jgi:hypothetical protein
MKLLSIVNARSLWFFDFQDLNPRGKDIREDLIDWIKESFNFSTAPDPATFTSELSTGKGLFFTGGSFQAREEVFVSVNFTMYLDGCYAETKSSTQDSDAFLEDLLTTASKEFGLAYDPSMIIKKIYISELIMRSDRSPADLNPKLREFAAKIKSFTPHAATEFEPSGISFWTDPVIGGRSQIFTFERQATKPFGERRFYSQAPMQTEQHLALLQELEQILEA